ncbi:VgrG-related protein [Kitasatospora sp. NPDC056327]|uniref:VgrG-related protein n=1 Tax=Kitasatospora sp. NPDC056327 TaxID=3345785 RepID=UPI0035D7F934
MGDTRERSYVAQAVVEFTHALKEPWAGNLTEVGVYTETGKPPRAVVRFLDDGHGVLAALGVRFGSPLVVSVMTGARAPVRIFTGEVVAFETEVTDGGVFTTVTGMNREHRLTQGRHIEAYTNMTIGKVVARIARRHELTVGRVDVESTVIPYLAQPNLTDWEFLTHQAQQRGLVLAVDGKSVGLRRRPTVHGDGGDRRAKPVVLRYRDNLVRLRTGLSSSGQVGAAEVRGWDVKQKKALVGNASAARSDAYGVGVTPGDAVKAFTDRPDDVKLVVSGRPFGTGPQVEAAARAVAADSAAAMAELDAEVYGTPRLRVGSVVELAGVGPPFAGTYTVTACDHVIDGVNGYRTRVRTGPPPPPIVPAPDSMIGRGLAVGVVTDNRAPDPGRQGAVRVQLPWLSGEYVTDWARTVQWGGKGGGGMVVPDVGDEVLVGFEQGCLDRPFVIGGLYNGQDRPTDHSIPLVGPEGRANRRSLCSREGDRVELLNVPDGARGVRLVSGDDKLTAYLDRGTTTIKLSAGEGSDAVTLTLDGSGSLTIDAGERGELTLRAGTVSIEATAGELTLAGQRTTITGTPVHIN